ncbi:poly(ADP-ribose) glycohydrolase isoform X2 [Condylostylus longicornis]|uniref:poly(ADP-ribose) glycohydrolase isoform X2 n=1 Tax=Condylostylus longicornis TaxID=2530218 RepID=UPI00244DD572|nr:poly(ADP-ribose) glycohydrolase isoform X2 [Condylostylus longicornis]
MGDNYFGSSIEEIYRKAAYLHEFDHIEDIRPWKNHAVLFQYPFGDSVIPQPYGRKKEHEDKDGVRLPFYQTSVIQIEDTEGKTTRELLWMKILLALESRDFDSSWELEEAIKSYNNRIGTLYSLHEYFSENYETSTYFFKVLLKRIISLALDLPHHIKTGIPLLKQGHNQSISLSQQQIASLLANAFLCTFPSRRLQEQNCPEINFNRLFESRGPQVLSKIECLINYFRRVCIKPPTGVLTFSRRSRRSADFPNWSTIKEPFSRAVIHITSAGTIEDNGVGLLQVDFANKYIGGGVLGGGCVQEEIRFVICPELIVSRLFTEFLKDNEALFMVGAEQFSSYTGYGYSFKFSKDHKDNIEINQKNRRRLTHIVAIDACYFPNSSRQYEPRFIKRELNKAFVGFFHSNAALLPPGVATGNWGCGAFGGDSQLKALIQLMVCTITNRPLLYFTFGDKKLSKEIHEMYVFLIDNNINVRQLFNYLCEYIEQAKQAENLYAFIRRRHQEDNSSFCNYSCNRKNEQNTKSHTDNEINKTEMENDLSPSEIKLIQETVLNNEIQDPWPIPSSTDQEKCYNENLQQKDFYESQCESTKSISNDLKLSDHKTYPESAQDNENNFLIQSDSKRFKSENEIIGQNTASTSAKPNKNLSKNTKSEVVQVHSYGRSS